MAVGLDCQLPLQAKQLIFKIRVEAGSGMLVVLVLLRFPGHLDQFFKADSFRKQVFVCFHFG